MSAPNFGAFLVLNVISFMVTAPAATAQGLPAVTECGQHIASGRLTADLDCSASGGHAVVIGGGTLDLAGFTITADASGAFDAVRCIDRCQVVGPGDILGGAHGIDVTFEVTPAIDVAYRLDVRNVRVSGAASDAVHVFHGRATVRDSVLEDSAGCGLEANDAVVVDSTIRNNGCGILAGKRAKIAGSTVEWNASPVPAGYGVGVSASKVRAKDSTFAGHLVGDEATTGATCDVTGCGDIRTYGRRPKLKNVSCDVSVNVVPQIDSSTTWTVAAWNLCADDSDFDRDGTPNEVDSCDSNPACSTADADADGRGDCCDNCPNTANFFQSDVDFDGTGNACE